MELRNLVTIPVIFHFLWVRTTRIPYEVCSPRKAIHNWPKSLNKVIHQLDLFRLKNDHDPSIRWLAGEEQLYLWNLAPDWSSCWLLRKTHCMKGHVQTTLCLQTTQLPSICQEPLAPFETNVLLFNRREFLSSIPRGSISFIMFSTKLRRIWIWWRSLRACQCLCTLINFEGLLFLHEWHLLFRNHLLSFPFLFKPRHVRRLLSEVIYEMFSYIELRIWNQVSHDHHSYERNLSNCI